MGQNLKKCLLESEGYAKYAYQDSLGYWSIGIGRCIDKRVGKGLSDDEINYLLDNDISQCRAQLKSFDWYLIQDDVRKDVLVELCFNLGLPKLLKFNQTLNSIANKNYDSAVVHLLNSKWAKQVQKSRIDSIIYRLIHGEYLNGIKT
jgi:lysozyme